MSNNFQLERERSSLSSFPDTKSLFSKLKSSLLPYTFLTPTLVVVTLFFFIPLVMVFILSFTNLDMTNFGILKWWQPANWTLDNYVKIFTNRFFPRILNNTLMYVSMTLIFFNVGMALVIALITTNINRRVGFAFRLIWLMCRLTPVVVYIMMWKALAGPAPMGVINKHILGPLGIGTGEYLLNTNPWLFIILVNGFIGASFGMIIFSSAIEAIPKDYMIASKVDGASTWQTIRYITIPMIRWPLLFVTTYQTLSLLTSFEQIMLLTDGGPGLYETEVWSLTAYHRAFTSYFGNTQWGYGSAWAVILVIIGIVMAIVYLRVFKFDELIQEPKIDQL
ncbi:Melibiose/raffinose/stachyose import permease protein MelD [subsurface metagenome]|nr:MAG: sugar ABC transporter permease [Candidatus Atribacteria bacterium 1244-E10-H5-B2]